MLKSSRRLTTWLAMGLTLYLLKELFTVSGRVEKTDTLDSTIMGYLNYAPKEGGGHSFTGAKIFTKEEMEQDKCKSHAFYVNLRNGHKFRVETILGDKERTSKLIRLEQLIGEGDWVLIYTGPVLRFKDIFWQKAVDPDQFLYP